jgi:vacuolar-type H+-ATPase subunit I/STV1
VSTCPRCGITVTHPTKTWSMVGRPSRTGERFKLTLGLFTCPECKKTFRTVIGKEREKPTLELMVKEVKGIERRLEQSLVGLKEKLEKLKDERSELLDEIERLKKAGEEKAQTLEKEIASIREEVDVLKGILADS